jgi:hypothetical protein
MLLNRSQPARRSMLSRGLFEGPNGGAQLRRSSAPNGQEGITPPPEALQEVDGRERQECTAQEPPVSVP